MRAIMVLIIGLNIFMVAAAFGEENSVTLKWGESASFPPYNITARDFSPGTVEEHPEICNNETKYNELTLHERTISGCNDYVFLNVSRDGSHVMDAILSKMNFTNSDGAEFTNETTYEDDEGSLKIHILDIAAGYNLITPSVDLDIIIEQNETEIDIANNLTIKKTVPDPANIYPYYQFIPVTIAVENIGNLNFPYIRVVDSAGDGFVSETQDLNWSISLRSGELWQAQYLIKPLKPASDEEYTIPPATLYIALGKKTYNLSTANITFILRSSDIILSKTADKKDTGNVTVNLSLKNNGSRAALVKVWDSFPQGIEIVSGELNFSSVLQPGNYYNSSYMLKIDDISGNLSLPPARFTFKEYKPGIPEGNLQWVQNITGSGVSNPVQIEFAVSAPVQNTPSPAPSAGIPSTETTPANNQGMSGVLWIYGYKLPYAYFAILAGALVISVIIFIRKVWRSLGLIK
jgi:hypothetical protein